MQQQHYHYLGLAEGEWNNRFDIHKLSFNWKDLSKPEETFEQEISTPVSMSPWQQVPFKELRW